MNQNVEIREKHQPWCPDRAFVETGRNCPCNSRRRGEDVLFDLQRLNPKKRFSFSDCHTAIGFIDFPGDTFRTCAALSVWDKWAAAVDAELRRKPAYKSATYLGF